MRSARGPQITRKRLNFLFVPAIELSNFANRLRNKLGLAAHTALSPQLAHQMIWARCTHCANAMQEWANFLTIACSAAVGSRKQTDAMGRLRQQARRGFHVSRNLPDALLSTTSPYPSREHRGRCESEVFQPASSKSDLRFHAPAQSVEEIISPHSKPKR